MDNPLQHVCNMNCGYVNDNRCCHFCQHKDCCLDLECICDTYRNNNTCFGLQEFLDKERVGG